MSRTVNSGRDSLSIRVYAVLAATLMLVTLGACSDDEPSADPSSSPSAQESVDPANVSPSDLPEVPVVKNERGAIKDLTLGDCDTAAGDQTVTGEITSTAKFAVDYLVTVSWTTDAGDVMGRGFAVIPDVKPGSTEAFEISAEVKNGATQCVKGASHGRIG